MAVALLRGVASYHTAEACREWGHPKGGKWQEDEDCCAGVAQAACAPGYRYAKGKVCHEEVECKAFSYECTLCQPGEECDSNYNVETEKGEDYDCKPNLWSGCYFLWSRPVWKSTSDTIAQTIFAQADRVDLLLSCDSAGEQTDRGRKPVGGQVRVDKDQMGGVWHLPRLRLLSFDRGLVDGPVWFWSDCPVLLFPRLVHSPRLLLLRRQGGRDPVQGRICTGITLSR